MAFYEPDCLSIQCQSAVLSVAFSPDGSMIAGGVSGKVCLLCSKTGHLLAELNHPERRNLAFWCVAFMPRNNDKQTVSILAAGCQDGIIYLWDTSTCKSNVQPICKLEGYTGTVRSVFTADGQKLVSGSYDHSIRIWDIKLPTHRQLLQLSGHSGCVTSIATTGNRIASGGRDGTVRIWDMTTGTQLLQMMNGHTGKVWSVACSPVEGGLCSHIVASSGSDKSIRLWDVSTGQQIAKLDHIAAVGSVAFSPDGKSIVSGSLDGNVRLWDLSTRRPRHVLKGSKAPVNSIAFSSDGKRVVSGSIDGFVRIWNL